MWLALDADTREIVGVYIGARDEAAACALWQSLPPIYRQCAVTYTNFWAAYAAVVPSKRHPCSGQTDRQNQLHPCDLTTRLDNKCLLLVRKTLSFSRITEESHRCHLVLCTLLQFIITCLALPNGLLVLLLYHNEPVCKSTADEFRRNSYY